ncbi:ABC transporter ATP-binding protein [Lacrimispora sp.]|uniref:ABC transporter ATP-binding protein n=1 Tax=Lacrimispora sp. TaxID=2719234 RepID=UPI00345F69C9
MGIILEAKGVSKHFGGLKAVNHVNMKVTEGSVFGIIGPNGAGKTTFFNLCSGTHKVTSGNIFFKGEDITNKTPEEIARKGIVRTFQNIKLFKYLSVLDNVKVGCHINTKTRMLDALLHTKTYKADEEYATKQAQKVLEEVGLTGYADTKAGNLPYGLQRKVEIARALAADPEILLLDEPAAGMNPAETWSLLEFIKNIKAAGRTVMVIEHDMKFVMNLCDEILVLSFGEKICEGLPDQVKNDEQVQTAYFGKGTIQKSNEVSG